MTRSRKWGSHLSSVRLRNLWSAHAHHRPKEVESPRKKSWLPWFRVFLLFQIWLWLFWHFIDEIVVCARQAHQKKEWGSDKRKIVSAPVSSKHYTSLLIILINEVRYMPCSAISERKVK